MLRTHADAARISWHLVGLDENVALDHDVNKFNWIAPEPENISKFLAEYGFKSLNRRIENLFGLKIQAVEVEVVAPKQEKKQINQIEIKSNAEFDEFLKKVDIAGIVSVYVQKDDENISFVCRVGDDLYIIPYVAGEQEPKDLFSFNQENPV